MNTTDALQRLEELATYYLHELDGFTMEQLIQQPNEGEWSIGQMYQHFNNSALYMQLRNIEHCMTQSEDSMVSPMGKTKEGAAIFEEGSLPPVRIHVPPSPQYTPEQPVSKEQLILGLNTVIHQMKAIEPTLEKASERITAPHPKFGGLHAKEWFLLIEMHYRHHLLQLKRLREAVESNV